jgi:hypothetical protein
MNCCEKCFKDRFLVKLIKNSGEIGNCSYCGDQDGIIISVEEIAPYFDVFSPYYEKLEHGENFIYGVQDPLEVGEHLYDLIQSDWSIFSLETEGSIAKKLLTDIMQVLNSEFDENDLYVKAAEAFSYESNVDVWDSFSMELKCGNRFFSSKTYIVENLINILNENEHNIFQNSIMYRGRLGKQPINKMGAPPKEYARSGRASPKGISYLYAAPHRATCVAELRPYKAAEITIVEMTAKRPLKFVALNTGRILISPFQFEGSLLQGVETLLLYTKVVSDLSKPIEPENSEIDYLPTQYLSELIKKEGYDGFMFKSSLGPGDNYVIFDEKNVELNHIEYYKVDDIQYTVHQSF